MDIEEEEILLNAIELISNQLERAKKERNYRVIKDSREGLNDLIREWQEARCK